MSSNMESGPYGQIILFGDSITEQSASQEYGFAFMPALQNIYLRRLDVINRGFSGYNTANALKILPDFMPSTKQAHVRMLVIFFGANDACLPSSPSGQHVPMHQYSQNLKDIIRHSSVEPHKPKIVLITPPPINEYQIEISDSLRGYQEKTRTAEHTKKYADACRQVGHELDVAVLDLWTAMMRRAGWKPGQDLESSKCLPENPVLKDMLRDGLHFNPKAYKVLFEEMVEVLKDSESAIGIEAIPWRFPYWKDAHTLKSP